jgi:hypothetical protein
MPATEASRSRKFRTGLTILDSHTQSIAVTSRLALQPDLALHLEIGNPKSRNVADDGIMPGTDALRRARVLARNSLINHTADSSLNPLLAAEITTLPDSAWGCDLRK